MYPCSFLWFFSALIHFLAASPLVAQPSSSLPLTRSENITADTSLRVTFPRTLEIGFNITGQKTVSVDPIITTLDFRRQWLTRSTPPCFFPPFKFSNSDYTIFLASTPPTQGMKVGRFTCHEGARFLGKLEEVLEAEVYLGRVEVDVRFSGVLVAKGLIRAGNGK